jgi:phytoene dehydrogenase-like protein
VSTVERWPGYQVDRGSSAHLMIRRTGIVEDLRLEECGLRYLDMDPWAWAPFGEQAITFSRSLAATCASIAAVCGERDALAYESFVGEWARRNRVVFDAFGEPPTPGRLGRRFMRIGRGGNVPPAEMGRQLLQPADQLLDETFCDERLKTALAWLGAQSGPPTHEPATAELVGWYALMHEIRAGRPIGGSGALTAALAERLRRLGGTLRTGDAVARITRTSGRVDGVLTAGGERIAARAVLAGCHVVTTFDLLGDAILADRVRSAVRVGDGLGMVVRVGCRDLPRYTAAHDVSAYAGMQLLVPSRRHLRVAYGDFLAGRLPAEPAVLAMTFSAAGPLDRAARPAQRVAVGAVAPVRPARRGRRQQVVGRRPRRRSPTPSWPRSNGSRPGSAPASSTCTCRPRWTSSASSGCCAAT